MPGTQFPNTRRRGFMIRARLSSPRRSPAQASPPAPRRHRPRPRLPPISADSCRQEFQAARQEAWPMLNSPNRPSGVKGDLVVDEFKVEEHVEPADRASHDRGRFTTKRAARSSPAARVSSTGCCSRARCRRSRWGNAVHPKMNSSNYKFTHANGSVTPKKVDKLEDGNAPAQGPAKAPAKKK